MFHHLGQDSLLQLTGSLQAAEHVGSVAESLFVESPRRLKMDGATMEDDPRDILSSICTSAIVTSYTYDSKVRFRRYWYRRKARTEIVMPRHVNELPGNEHWWFLIGLLLASEHLVDIRDMWLMHVDLLDRSWWTMSSPFLDMADIVNGDDIIGTACCLSELLHTRACIVPDDQRVTLRGTFALH